ncbi:S41 family peptidase [endosymbiont 'TC1' of Trimyema compressum]|uniref:S41 family peptidase n=1 Tax=endosymbiont 'TC1' of Trimyema compressum TaxID=243899 RepID=UPI002481573E|nr:S41 family peptidase [endosymbiont 'TC1' of Trimyema compressum]
MSLPSVSGGFLKSESDTLYVEIPSFVENTSSELETLIKGLDKKPKKVILDLRGNGGGLVEQAIKVASYFVPEGAVLYELGRDANSLETFNVSGANFLDVPLAVLVDGNTASSSEILAGAIQDRQSGKLIGETTYGKAVMQSVIPTPAGGGIRLTTKCYLTPNKRDINKTG